jgi:hypothetical protein
MREEPSGDAVEQEREMKEHEREARERDPDERAQSEGRPDEAENPAPPGSIQRGGPGG